MKNLERLKRILAIIIMVIIGFHIIKKEVRVDEINQNLNKVYSVVTMENAEKIQYMTSKINEDFGVEVTLDETLSEEEQLQYLTDLYEELDTNP